MLTAATLRHEPPSMWLRLRLACGSFRFASPPARLLVPLLAAASLGQTRPAPADLILHNGRVVTVNASFGVSEAVAAANGRITAVGPSADVLSLAGRNTRVIDLAGKSVIPGLIDNHLHGAGGGPGVDLSRARSLETVLSAIKARVASAAVDAVIVSNSDWHEAQLVEQRLPLRDDLDRVARSHAVVLVRGGHEYILNSAALARWRIDEKTAEPDGGRITRYPDGRLNGELVDTAKSLVTLPRPAPASLDDRIASRAADYRRLNAVGLTTVRHPGVSIDEYRMLQEMRRRGLLTMRLRVLLRPFDLSRGAAAADTTLKMLDESGITMDEGDEWLRVVGIKLAVDGGFEGGLMRDVYEAPHDERGSFRGLATADRDTLITVVRALNRRGWQVSTHAVGDAAMDLVLDAYDAAHGDQSIAGRHWTIEHAFIGRPDHLPRLKALQVALSVQDHLYLAGPSLVKYWGRARAFLTTPVRMYLDAGLLVSSGTDAPVVPYPPLWTYYHFVTRDTLTGGVMGAEQAITREEALRLATINNARLTFDERDGGSIEQGKRADLVVLSVDPLQAPAGLVRDARVLLTVVGGKVVYEP
jgi:predicted amidohydrolase YtcJ